MLNTSLQNLVTRLYCLALTTFLFIPLFSKAQSADNIRLAFYNVENLFDPSDDPEKDDEEFTPDGKRHWSEYRYREKSNRMAKAILSIGDWDAPDVVGLAEVENQKVVEDLAKSEVLRKFNYGVVHFESPDRRGIDVAMLYRTDRISLLYSNNIPLTMPDDPDFASRDILYVKLLTTSGDTLHVMYCHWPSRYGGQAESEPKRIRAATLVRQVADSLFSLNPEVQIVIAGDLNDEWNNISINDYLVPATATGPALVNLMAALPEGKGSHRYHGVWSYLDQIIVSPALVDDHGLDIKDKTATVVDREFLLEKDEKYPGIMPFRSFLGLRYHGGFSDHLPVYIDLVTNQK